MSFFFALSKGKKEIKVMIFNFNNLGELTEDHAIQLVNHHALAIKVSCIYDAIFGRDFMDTVSKYVDKSSKLRTLGLLHSKIDDDDTKRHATFMSKVLCRPQSGGDAEGQDEGVQLAGELAKNNTIETLWLYVIVLLG